MSEGSEDGLHAVNRPSMGVCEAVQKLRMWCSVPPEEAVLQRRTDNTTSGAPQLLLSKFKCDEYNRVKHHDQGEAVTRESLSVGVSFCLQSFLTQDCLEREGSPPLSPSHHDEGDPLYVSRLSPEDRRLSWKGRAQVPHCPLSFICCEANRCQTSKTGEPLYHSPLAAGPHCCQAVVTRLREKDWRDGDRRRELERLCTAFAGGGCLLCPPLPEDSAALQRMLNDILLHLTYRKGGGERSDGASWRCTSAASAFVREGAAVKGEGRVAIVLILWQTSRGVGTDPFFSECVEPTTTAEERFVTTIHNKFRLQCRESSVLLYHSSAVLSRGCGTSHHTELFEKQCYPCECLPYFSFPSQLEAKSTREKWEGLRMTALDLVRRSVKGHLTESTATHALSFLESSVSVCA